MTWSRIGKGVLQAAVVSAFGMAGTAAAADLGHDRGSIKDAPVVAGYSWQGFYVGAHAGLVTGNTQGLADLSLFGGPAIATDYSLAGALYGVHAGYNLQRGAVVFGIEGSWSGSNVQGNTACVVVFDCKREVDSVYTLAGRLGWAMNRTMVYGLLGVAWGEVNTKVTSQLIPISLSSDERHVGWVAGFGLEHALSDRVSFRIEYTRIDLGDETHNLAISPAIIGFPAIPDKVDVTIDTIRLGVNIKLTN
jgi:outer membrane immunogenic protein